jgi:hypothetical protein
MRRTITRIYMVQQVYHSVLSLFATTEINLEPDHLFLLPSYVISTYPHHRLATTPAIIIIPIPKLEVNPSAPLLAGAPVPPEPVLPPPVVDPVPATEVPFEIVPALPLSCANPTAGGLYL